MYIIHCSSVREQWQAFCALSQSSFSIRLILVFYCVWTPPHFISTPTRWERIESLLSVWIQWIWKRKWRSILKWTICINYKFISYLICICNTHCIMTACLDWTNAIKIHFYRLLALNAHFSRFSTIFEIEYSKSIWNRSTFNSKWNVNEQPWINKFSQKFRSIFFFTSSIVNDSLNMQVKWKKKGKLFIDFDLMMMILTKSSL